MKKSCEECKAKVKTENGYGCVLEYKVDQIYHARRDLNPKPISCKPLEDCPKPRTIKHTNELKMRII